MAMMTKTKRTDLMNDKRVLITGATNGIGKTAALDLAKMGAEVIIVGRNEKKTRRVLDEIQAASGSDRLDMLIADLSSIEQIRRVADEFRGRYDERLDVLLNNAGAIFPKYQESADGLEMTFALNHISYFLLTHLLLDNLKQTAQRQGEARIINVSSSAHRGAQFNGPDEANAYSSTRSYGKSKLANVLFTYDLARRLEGTGVTVNAVHPGLVDTGFGSEFKGFLGWLIRALQMTVARSPEKGAETLVYLASSPEVRGVSAKYWKDKKQVESSKASFDAAQQRRLWELSETVTGMG